MKVINTKTHGLLDYLMGIILIASPWIFGFADNDTAKWIPIILGIGMLLYSLMTNYEMGMSKTISMKTHLTLDIIAGIFLAVSPWVFGFSEDVYAPHLIFGLLEVGAAMMTKTTPANNFGNAKHSHAV